LASLAAGLTYIASWLSMYASSKSLISTNPMIVGDTKIFWMHRGFVTLTRLYFSLAIAGFWTIIILGAGSSATSFNSKGEMISTAGLIDGHGLNTSTGEIEFGAKFGSSWTRWF